MRRPVLRESFFLAWSAAIVALVSLGPITDGGASSPLIAGLFLPLAFAALSYPLGLDGGRRARWSSAPTSPSPSGMGGVETPAVCFMTLALACATWMCASQARNHDRQRQELARVSRADPLTGCLNRRGFEERFAAELSRAARTGAHARRSSCSTSTTSRRVNDEHGPRRRRRPAALGRARRWAPSLRPSDAIGRLGGDEFAVLAPGAGAADGDAARRAPARRARPTVAPASLGVVDLPAGRRRPRRAAPARRPRALRGQARPQHARRRRRRSAS